MMEVVVTNGAIGRAKLQSNRRHQYTNTRLFTGQMPFLSPNQKCRALKEILCYKHCRLRSNKSHYCALQ